MRRLRSRDPYAPQWRSGHLALREMADNGDETAQQVLLEAARAGLVPSYQPPSQKQIRERRSLETDRQRLRAELQRRLQ